MKLRVIITLVTFFYIILSCYSFDLDMTVDDDIRKNYNSSKLINDVGIIQEDESLPALPSITKHEKTNSTTQKNQNIKSPSLDKLYAGGNIKISKGNSFNVTNTSAISDWQTKGTKVKFKLKNQVIKKKYTIPTSTVFTGEIIESHKPQYTGNGGLVVIRIRSMSYKGQTIPLNAYVTIANSKHIFLNNIKGERKYLKTMWKKGNWGRKMFDKMFSMTINLGSDGSTLLLSPFPFAYGTLCLGLNTLTSPITAFFSKGGHVSIPAGSNFRIKLLDDAYID